MEEEFEKLMARVLKAIPGISREEVEAMVDEKVKSNLYLNRVGALLLVAEELGIFDVREKVSEEILEEASYVNLGELVPGLNNVSVKGVIYAVIGPITSKNYRLLKLKVGDRTGRLEVYVWEDKIKEIENLSLRVGDHIAIINAHTKEKLETGEVEIHLKKTSIIKKLYRDPSLPDPRQFYKNLGEILDKGEGTYDIKALVISILGERSIGTKHGEVTVIDIVVSDGQKDLMMTAWGEKVQEFRDLRIGEEIYLTDVRFDGSRLNLTSRSFIVLRETKEELLKSIQDRRKMGFVMRVVDVQPSPTYAYVTVTDGERIIHILHQDLLQIDLKEGDYIEVIGVDRDELYKGKLVRCRRETIKKVDKILEEIPIPKRNVVLKEIVGEKKSFMENIVIEGTLYTKTNLLTIETKYGIREKILFWIKDMDTAVQGVAWRTKAQEISQIPEGSRIRLKWVDIKLSPFNELEVSVNPYSKIEKI